jgi:beta-glucosidase
MTPLRFAAATSSFQIEGAAEADGKGPSIWDTFCREPGRIIDGSDGVVACDSYHRWADDLDLLSRLGVDAYRFSVAWPRIQPTGSDPVEKRGLDYYDRLVDGLAERGLAAHVTLYHWDLPQALQDSGGWPNRATVERFAEYAGVVAERLGDRVERWATFNEPWVAAFMGHAAGGHAPGHRSPDEAFRTAHHLLLAHAQGAEAVRAQVSGADVGIVLNLTTVRADDDSLNAVANRIDAQHNALWLDPLRDGRYPELAVEIAPVLDDESLVHPGDLEQIRGSASWLGINYYTPMRISAAGGGEAGQAGPGQEVGAFPGVGTYSPAPRPPLTTMGWEVDASGLVDLLDRLHAWNPSMPLHITENGAAYPDSVRAEDGSIDDQDRIEYLRQHLAVVDAARERGIDLRTYTLWSLLDNFEWAMGYTQTFGVVEVEPRTLARRPKASFCWFADEIARRRR